MASSDALEPQAGWVHSAARVVTTCIRTALGRTKAWSVGMEAIMHELLDPKYLHELGGLILAVATLIGAVAGFRGRGK